MRKGLLLMPRDRAVINHLGYGPATRTDIYNNFFRNENENQKTRERVMDKRMNRMENSKMIVRISSPQIQDTAYVLHKNAASIVAENLGIELGMVWVNQNLKNIRHDLFVSSIARRIVNEASKKKLYTLEFIEFEHGMRKNGQLKKGVYLADILCKIRGKYNTRAFNIEVDCGTVCKRDFLGKMRFFKDTILVMTSTQGRLKLLIRYLKTAGLGKSIYLTTFKSFFDNSLAARIWHKPSSDDLCELYL